LDSFKKSLFKKKINFSFNFFELAKSNISGNIVAGIFINSLNQQP